MRGVAVRVAEDLWLLNREEVPGGVRGCERARNVTDFGGEESVGVCVCETASVDFIGSNK